jgi:nitrite reductase/ring-hydroxylating ferredoxin subunit
MYPMAWIDVMPVADLETRHKRVARVNGRQILFLETAGRIVACPNRCPHEGFPLSEGDCSDDGKLRCNWHNWTFDLVSGATMVGGDTLPQYPVKIEGGRVLIELPHDEAEERRRRALAGILTGLEEADQQHLLRETVRLEIAGGDRADTIRVAIAWLAPRLKYGTTHAIAGASDWLALADAPESAPDQQLAAIGEILGHIAEDGRRAGRFPFTENVDIWDPAAFLASVEAGNEAEAIARIHGALTDGLHYAELIPALAAAALAHYADFGHSLIYVVKTGELVERLGSGVEAPLLALLVRSVCYATREDLLPEFRRYRAARERWTPTAPTAARERPPLLLNMSVASALDMVAGWSVRYNVEAILRTLVDSALFVLLHIDEEMLATTHGSIARNATWLNFTHAITFAEAGARVARESPALWPDVLLQLACFIGRSKGFVKAELNVEVWQHPDAAKLLAQLREELFDHGRERFIVSVHLIKTLFAAERLLKEDLADPDVLASALDRYYHAPAKGRHVLRTARQMLAVAADSFE